MTKSLLQILDAALFPAALMVVGKFIGLYISVQLFDLEWGVENTPNSFFSTRPVLYSDDIVLVSTNSDIFLLLVMLAGFSFYVIKATFLHDTHITPKMITKLAVTGLLSLISSSYEIYRHATVWLIFMWATDVTILINALNGKTESWVAIVGFATTFLMTVVLLRDVVYEIKLSRENLSKV